MHTRLRSVALMIGLGLVLVYLEPTTLHAQDVQAQRAYEAGYQNGVNDARQNKPMNNSTDDWHGDRLTAYQRGYREGYASIAGYRHGGHRNHNYADPEAQKAYEAGYRDGMRDGQNSRTMHPDTDDWHGDRLTAYQEGYEEGYGNATNNGQYGRHTFTDPEAQRAYDSGYQNGIHDAQNNRAKKLDSDDWHGDRLRAYQQGYQEGYGSIRGQGYRSYNDPLDQSAYEAGYRNGLRDGQDNRAMNLNTDDWHGARLQIYQTGYQDGYNRAGRQ